MRIYHIAYRTEDLGLHKENRQHATTTTSPARCDGLLFIGTLAACCLICPHTTVYAEFFLYLLQKFAPNAPRCMHAIRQVAARENKRAYPAPARRAKHEHAHSADCRGSPVLTSSGQHLQAAPPAYLTGGVRTRYPTRICSQTRRYVPRSAGICRALPCPLR